MSTFTTPDEALAAFTLWIRRTGFLDATQRLYLRKTAAFLTWLAEQGDEYDGALSDPHVRDYAVRDYRRHLMTEQHAAVSTVESAISAIGTFYDYLGLGRPQVRRAKKAKPEPKSLNETELRKVMRAAERRGLRDFAIVHLLFGTGVRVSDVHALNTDDVFLTERMGTIEVRYGKGGEPRTVHPPADCRAALRAWLNARRAAGAPELGPVFLSRTGGRLSVRRLQSLMDDLQEAAGIETNLSPHVLRHTYARFFLEAGGDLGELQQNLGHASLATTQVYTGASAGQRIVSAERVRIDL